MKIKCLQIGGFYLVMEAPNAVHLTRNGFDRISYGMCIRQISGFSSVRGSHGRFYTDEVILLSRWAHI